MKTNVFIALLAVFSLAAGTLRPELVPKKGGNLFIGQNADALTLDPAEITDAESSKVTLNIFEGLVRYKDDSTEVEPALAVSWDVSEHGKKWVFHLRKGVQFHDGTPFNAEAVVFSFLRQIDPAHPFFQNDFSYAGFTFRYVESVEALDKHTVRISLKKPYTPFLSNLAMNSASPIISPDALKKWGKEFKKHPAGTGPFKFEEWIPNDRIVLTANPGYWGKPPFLKKLFFRAIPNPYARFREFQAGRIHVMDVINPTDVAKITQLPNGRLSKHPGLNVGYLAMNTEKKPFDSIKVRQAFNHAINKQKLIKLFFKNLAVPAKNPIPPTLWGYNDEIDDYEYNPQKAVQLLKEAGYKHGTVLSLLTMDISRPYIPQPKKIARAVKGNLAAVGIKVRIITYDWGTYINKAENGEHDLCLSGWIGDNGDPDNFLYTLLDKDNTVKPARNAAFFKHDRLHEILVKAQQASDKQERIRLYHQAQEIIHHHAPWVPLVHAQQIGAYQKNVHGVVFHTTGIIKYNRAWIE
ncbi:MAG: ABC transporter substrate-binding protein [Desulfobacteraceae bacterium]|nr:ABC transporter substrate-binding protein [Desulfobacteraceae bacterium]